MNRPNRPAPAAHEAAPAKKSRFKDSALMKGAYIAFLVTVTILAVALIWFVALGKPNSEAKRVDDSNLQAVFLNGGQVYFGRITHLNDQYIRLVNIYYLRVNQQVQPDGQAANATASDISLVKLGCELHGPQDEMLINRPQVIFWENLKQDGDVTEAVKKYVSQNPDGQNCDEQQSSQTTEQKAN